MPHKKNDAQIEYILGHFDFESVYDWWSDLDTAGLRELARQLLLEAEREWKCETKRLKKGQLVGPLRISEHGFTAEYDGLYFRLSYCIDSLSGADLQD